MPCFYSLNYHGFERGATFNKWLMHMHRWLKSSHLDSFNSLQHRVFTLAPALAPVSFRTALSSSIGRKIYWFQGWPLAKLAMLKLVRPWYTQGRGNAMTFNLLHWVSAHIEINLPLILMWPILHALIFLMQLMLKHALNLCKRNVVTKDMLYFWSNFGHDQCHFDN